MERGFRLMTVFHSLPRASGLGARALGVALSLTFGLAGCADIPRTVTHEQPLNDVFHYVRINTLPLEVYGNPFPGGDDQAVAEASAAGMSGQVNGRPLTFVSVPQGQAVGEYRTVLFLGRGGVVSGRRLCGDGLAVERQAGDSIHASAALCQGSKLMAWAEGWLGAQDSPQAPAYQALMNQMADAVFARTRDHRGNDDAWPDD